MANIDSHKLSVVLDQLLTSFQRIKLLSDSNEVRAICDNDTAIIWGLVEGCQIKEEFNQVVERRINPTN